jgi:hypothetical protein
MIDAALRLGLTLGLAHASDADHVCTIASLLRAERGVAHALRTSLLWGLGHSSTFFGVGLFVVAAGVRLPSWLNPLVDSGVAISLVWLGVRQWRHVDCASPTSKRHEGRTFALGLMHGLAGSAGVGLIALTTMQDRTHAVVFLAIYGLSVVAGMILVTFALALPLGAATRSSSALRALVLRGAALISISAGIWLSLQIVVPASS